VIVVDTSVWVSVLRSPGSPEAPLLVDLLDADEVGLALPVRVELLSGASTPDRAKLRRTLSALPVFYPTDETWALDADFARMASVGLVGRYEI
jgi:predicted nucleic acid-binding protein